MYNQPTNIPPSVTHLTFGRDYNQPTIIPPSVIQHNLPPHLILDPQLGGFFVDLSELSAFN